MQIFQKFFPRPAFPHRAGQKIAAFSLFSALWSFSGAALAQVAPINTTPIFSDDFSGAPNPALWSSKTTAFGIQATQFGNTPQPGRDTDGTSFVSLPIHSFNPNNPGTRFLGTELMSREKWNLGTGLEFEARLRMKSLPPGLVLGFFTYGNYGEWTSTYQKTEIDYEFLTKQGSNKIWLNIWDDWNPERRTPDAGALFSPPGLNWNNGAWQNYRIRWYPDRTEWIINGQLVHTNRTIRPGAPMGVWFNIWAPTSSWGTAFDAAMVPVATASANRTFSYDLDFVRVRPIPAPSRGFWGNGTGLTARYFDNSNFTGNTVLRRDHRVNFDWGPYAPAPNLGVDTFSARWSGTVQAQFNETYTFTARSDDGVRLWVNNKLVIDNWRNQSPTERSGTIALQAGVKVPIRLEYYENSGGAVCQLFWSSPSTPRQIVPQSQLYPEAGVEKPVISPAGGTFSGAQTVRITSATSGATIRYTLDGSDPNELGALLANGATLRIGKTATVRARAFLSGRVPSDIASEHYEILDTKQPVAAVVSPAQGTFWRAVPQITGTASDGADGSRIARVTVQLARLSDGRRWNGSSWISSDYGLQTTLTAKPLSGDATNAEWVCNGPFPSGANATAGQYEIKVFAYDVYGNLNNPNIAPARSTFTLDLISPSVAIATPAPNSTVSDLSSVSGTASDESWGSGIDRVNLVIVRQSDGRQWNGWEWVSAQTGVPVALSNGNWSFVSPASNGARLPIGSNLPNGAYLLRAVAFDRVGNAAVAERMVYKGTSATTTSVRRF